LAYPRLFLLFAMFVGCVYFIASPKAEFATQPANSVRD
jgi:hypothetical protein